ncbi:hypothetical protein ACO2JO_04815 [Leptospira interrogans]
MPERISPRPLESRFCCVGVFCDAYPLDRARRSGTDHLSGCQSLRQNWRAWVEADYETTDLETVIQDLLTGQYSNPIRVVAFNTAERWSEDVSEDVAHELRRRCDLQMCDLPSALSDFIERHEGADRRQWTLRLV